MSDIEILVPLLPPASGSLNSRVHWAIRYRDAIVYKQAVAMAFLRMGWSGPTFSRPKIEYEFVVAQRRPRDVDNLLARMKSGQDALVALGVLRKDSMDYLEVCIPTVIVNKARAPATIIRIWERE